MRTTLKKGVGRGAGLNGKNGHAVYPPGTVSPVVRYSQPPPSGRTGVGLLSRILLGTLLTIVAIALAAAGGHTSTTTSRSTRCVPTGPT